MANKIFKYPLAVIERQEIEMPIGASALRIEMQGGTPTLWAIVDDDARTTTRFVRMYGTGWECGESREDYLGTVQVDGFVWHYFW